MAARVNQKFIIILLLVLFSAAGIGGALYYYQFRQNAARNVRIGDEYVAQGDLQKARNHYGRAVRKEPGNREYLRKYEETLLQLVPKTPDYGNELYQQRLAVLQHRAQHYPLNADDHLGLLEELHRHARLTGRGYLYELLESSAENMIERVHTDDAKRPYGRLYRGVARIHQTAYSAEELEDAESDLQIFIDEFPESDFGWASLVDAKLTIFNRLQIDGQTRRANEKFEEAETTLRMADAAGVNGLEIAKLRLLVAAQKKARDPDSVTEDEIIEALEGLMAQIKTDSPPWSVAESMNAAQIAYAEEIRSMVKAALTPYVEAHLTHPRIVLQMARLLYEWGQLDDSERYCRALLDADPLPVGIRSQLQFMLRPEAAGVLTDITYQRWVLAENDEQRSAAIDEMEQAYATLKDLTGGQENHILVLRAEGKLAFAKGDYVTSASRFEHLLKSADELSDDRNIDHLVFAIHSQEQLGNIGLAHERTLGAIELRPNHLPFLLKQAELEVRMRQFDQAKETLEQILARVPDNERANQLMRLADAGGDTSQIASDDPVVQAIRQAQDQWRQSEHEQARSTLLTALETHGENVGLLLTLARLELLQQNRDDALEYANRGLALQPDSVPLMSVKNQAENEDPIVGMRRLAESLNEGDPVEVDAAMVMGLAALISRQESNLAQLEQDGSTAEAAEASDLIDRAQRDYNQSLQRLENSAPNHPVLIQYSLSDAIREKKWDVASKYVERAAEQNLDGANGDVFRAQLQMAQQEYRAAVRTLLDVTTRMGYSTRAWNLLGRAYNELGNFTEARRAFEQAYRGNPSRLDVVESYVGVLMQTGELIRALDVMRDARNLAPNNPAIRNTWLELESQVGNPMVAIKERRDWYEESPDNRINAIRLATILGSLEPDQSTIVTADGKPRFNERVWRQMDSTDRQTVIEQTRSRWYDEADAIVARLTEQEQGNIEVAALRAELLRARGQVSAGEEVLRTFIANTPESERTAQLYVVLGRYLANANRTTEAISIFREGQKYQTDDSRPISIALGDVYFGLGQLEDALAQFNDTLAVNDNPSVRLRVVECLIGLDRLEEASAALKEAVDRNGASFTTWLLSSAILESEADRLAEQGKQVEANFKYQEFKNALDSAQELRPGDILPKLRLARHLIQQHSRTGNNLVLEEALRVLASADAIDADDVRINLVRVDVLRAMGNTRSAIAELRRVLERSPDEGQARTLLIAMLVNEGDIDGAIAAAQQGIANNATVSAWHVQLGDIYANYKKDYRAAVRAYTSALALESSADIVRRVGRTRLLAGDPPMEVVAFLQQYPQYQRTDTRILGLMVDALAKGNQPDAIESLLRQIYSRVDSMIEQGVLDPGAISGWFRIAREGTEAFGPDKIETLLMELTDQDPTGYELSAIAFLYRIQGDPASRSRGIQIQHQAIAKISDAPASVRSPYYYDLGTMLVEAGEYQEAVDMFKKSVELNPEHALAYNNYAYLMSEELGNPQGAVEYAAKAAELLPDNASVLDTYGWVNYRLGNYDNAETAIRRSLDLERTPATLLHLAEVLIAKGEYDRAVQGPLRDADEMQTDAATQAEIDRLLNEIETKRGRGQ